MLVSEIMKQLMAKSGMGSRALSRALDLPQNAVSYYINGKRKPSIENCYRIIKFAKKYEINITLEDLYPDD